MNEEKGKTGIEGSAVHDIKSFFRQLFAGFKYFLRTPAGGWWIALFLMLVDFNIVWATLTTFRAFSDWMLWVVNIGVAALLALPYILTKNNWIQWIVATVVSFLLIANLMYCRTYFTAIPPGSYLLASNLKDFGPSVLDSMRPWDFSVTLWGVAGLLAGLKRKRSSGSRSDSLGFKYIGLIILVTSLFSGIGLTFRGGLIKEYGRLVDSCYYTTCGVPTYTVGGHILYYIAREESVLSPARKAEVFDWLSRHEKLVALSDSTDGVKRQNLVVILCESLESWVIGREISGKEITPNLNSLIKESSTFYAPRLLTQVASGRSIDCQLLLDAGMLPLNSSVYSMVYADHTYPSLLKAMKERDEATRGWILTCDKPIVWNQEPIARAFGIDTLLTKDSWKIDELVGNPPKLSDGSFIRQSIDKMKNGEIWREGEPGFLQFVTYSGHNPFRLPTELKDPDFVIPEGVYPERFADYVEMAHYTDSHVGKLVEYLRSRTDYRETLIVITGDHEGLASDRREILKNGKAREFVSENQFTPFIVLNSPSGGEFGKVAGQVDMYSTILDMMGLDEYFWKGMGTSMLSAAHPGFAISSMTNEIVGDTVGVDPERFSLMKKARGVSNDIITFDLINEIDRP